MSDDTATAPPTGTIEVTFAKAAELFIDGKSYGKSAGETKTFEVPAGTRELHAKAAWCGSQKREVVVSEGEHVSLTLDSFSGESVYRAVMFVFVGLFMMTKTVVFLVLAGLALVVPIYYVTIGSGRYLKFVAQD